MTAKELIPNLRRESFGNVVSLIRSSNLISSGLFSHTKSAKAKELKFLVMTGGYSHQFWQLTCSVWGRVVLSWRWDWPRWEVRCEGVDCLLISDICQCDVSPPASLPSICLIFVVFLPISHLGVSSRGLTTLGLTPLELKAEVSRIFVSVDWPQFLAFTFHFSISKGKNFNNIFPLFINYKLPWCIFQLGRNNSLIENISSNELLKISATDV